MPIQPWTRDWKEREYVFNDGRRVKMNDVQKLAAHYNEGIEDFLWRYAERKMQDPKWKKGV